MTTEAKPSSIEEQAAKCKQAAEQYRAQVRDIYSRARQEGTPEEYRHALEQVRAVQDGLEEYVSLAISVRGALGRAALDAQLAYDEAWAKEADRSSRASSGGDFEGARERYARFDIKVFSEMRAARQAERHRLVAQELLDDMWLRYRAINATREDLHQILRAFQFERVLER